MKLKKEGKWEDWVKEMERKKDGNQFLLNMKRK